MDSPGGSVELVELGQSSVFILVVTQQEDRSRRGTRDQCSSGGLFTGSRGRSSGTAGNIARSHNDRIDRSSGGRIGRTRRSGAGGVIER